MALPFLEALKYAVIDLITWQMIEQTIICYQPIKTKHMNWYLAKIVFRIVCGDGEHTPQFDEQLRLILASSKEEAFKKAGHKVEKEKKTFIMVSKQR